MHWEGMRSRVAVCVIVCAFFTVIHAQGSQTGASNQKGASSNAAALVLPKGYVIGAEDVLSIVLWREKEISSDVIVRPDGMISLPLLRDVQAAGYTPEQLAEIVEKTAVKYVTDSDTTVIVKPINSRKVFVLGEVGKPGVFPLTTELNVLQLISAVGGLLEFADKGNITIIRNENGQERRFKFNYNEVIDGKKLQQNIMLQPGDTVLIRRLNCWDTPMRHVLSTFAAALVCATICSWAGTSRPRSPRTPRCERYAAARLRPDCHWCVRQRCQ